MSFTIKHDTRHSYTDLNGKLTYTSSLAKLFAGASSSKYLLQGGVRQIARSNSQPNTFVALYEDAPQLRRIRFQYKYMDKEGMQQRSIQDYQIWTPWVLYFIVAGPQQSFIQYMYFMKGPFQGVETPMYFPTIPNVYFTDAFQGKVCNGQLVSHTVMADGAVNWQGTIAGVMSDFWSSTYNEDIMAFQDLNPFTIIHGLQELEEEGKGVQLPTIHQGMKNWESLSAEQVMDLPFHYLFNFITVQKKMQADYTMVEDTQVTQAFRSHYQQISHTLNHTRL